MNEDKAHRNGAYTEPKGGAKDGYGDRIPRTTAGINEARARIARELELDRLRQSIHRADHGSIL